MHDPTIFIFAASGILSTLCAGAAAYFGIRSVLRDKRAKKSAERDRLLLRTVAHDLRSPLGGIKGYADWLLSEQATSPDGKIDAERDEKRQQALFLIACEAERLARLCDRLTSREFAESFFSDTDDALPEISSENKREIFDLGELAHTVTLVLAPKAARKKLSFVEIGSGEEMPLYVCADRDAVWEALYNLCDNAVKYSDENESIALRFERVYSDKCANNTDQSCNRTGDADENAPNLVRLSIENTCRDFDPTDSASLFLPNYRGKTRNGGTGSGLGLYIAERLIRLQGGEALTFSYDAPICRFSFGLQSEKGK